MFFFLSAIGYVLFLVASQEIGWEERLRNDLFCGRLGGNTLSNSVDLSINQSINLPASQRRELTYAAEVSYN